LSQIDATRAASPRYDRPVRTAPSPPLSRLLLSTADAVAAVRAGRSLTDALARVPAELRPGTQALAFRVLRALGAALVVRQALAPKTPPPVVDALLLSALALMWPGDDPAPYAEHTLVDQAVAAARDRAPAAAGFVNAVLRRFTREREAQVAAARHAPLAAFNHPLWWIERVKQDWPRQWQAILETSQRHPPMTLRVNARRCSGAAYQQRLAASGRAALRLEDPVFAGQALVLADPCPVGELPGFAEGDVSVQDAAAQRAAALLLGDVPSSGASGDAGPTRPPLRAGARVLDACAAPGGKTAQLLERADLDLLALDSDPQRLLRVQETLQRLHLRAELKCADARDPARWWDGRPFDAVLLDAPCTASGIVRRHPDVRWLRRPDDVVALSRVQGELLEALWPLVAPGGRLLYATCSVFRAEGADRIEAFLQRHAARGVSLDPASPGHLLPLADNGRSSGAPPEDGFFYALLRKT
jgi:16S rRNA (cytosine967-C5)-methyltransferase